MPSKFPEQQSLYAPDGQRKYVNAQERQRFLIMAFEAGDHDPKLRTLCEVLAYTGCRISEALALTTTSVYLAEGVIAIHSLKKRNVVAIRHVPIPDELLILLNKVHHIEQAKAYSEPQRLWTWHRVTAYHKIKALMISAKISGLPCCPKGLRHGFGVHAIGCGIPMNLVQRWLGHADISTTAIYLNAVGKEERRIAGSMW